MMSVPNLCVSMFNVEEPLKSLLTAANGGVEAIIVGRRREGLPGQYFLIPEAA